MKRRILPIMCVLLLCAQSGWAYPGPWSKLYAGVKQVITGPFSLITVPAEQMNRENDQALGLLGGIMEGAAQTAIIPLKGLFNIITFPIVDYTDLPLD